MSLLSSPLFEIKPEVIEQIFSIASVCDDVRVPEEQNVFHMSSWKGMWTFRTCYMNYGENKGFCINKSIYLVSYEALNGTDLIL